MNTRHLWILWSLLTLAASGYLTFAVTYENTTTKRILLPGETTHGHYQIELACDACHTKFMGVKQEACTGCHGEELKREKDTHPASKFNDPTNADRLAKLDAQKCITCHREHVPDRTHAMGLSIPTDYCFHCHEDVAEDRPSHQGMKHDSCATAGCHNYHDNKALYENFLYQHCDEADVSESPSVVLRNFLDQWTKRESERGPLSRQDADAPSDLLLKDVMDQWSSTAHAAAGVNCRDCHDLTSEDERTKSWTNKASYETCTECHEKEGESFLLGRHGMRIAQKMSPMRPGMARLEMHADAAHRNLDCSACHPSHRFDTQYAAVQACMSCHNDEHTQNYLDSSHYELWKSEMSGTGGPGTGVSCATCHLPRVRDGDRVHVQHNQNYNLRPNEKMIRSVCMNCHGLEFSLSSLADPSLVQRCFAGPSEVQIDSAQMAKRWFEEKEKQRQKRKD